MKLPALAALLALCAPAFAQDAPQTAPAPAPSPTPAPGQPGGYAPTRPLFSKPPVAGDTVVFVPNTQTPDQAFPPPPPKAEYPICKKGQFDGCRQPD